MVPQDSEDEPASVLLERIAAEKKLLVKEKKIKKQKELSTISESDKPFELPQNWKFCRLNDLTIAAEAGWSPQCELHPREGNNWGVLKVSAVTWGVYKPKENKELPQALEPRPKYEVKSGDFLISRANTAELVAKAVVVPENAPKYLMMSDKIIRFQFSKTVSSHYINLVNNSMFSRSYYAQVAGGTSSSMKNVSQGQVRNLIVALPPLAEQHRIVTKVNELMSLCDQLEQQTETSLTAHTSLVENLLATLTSSTDAAELEQNWHRIAEHFTTLFTTESSIDQLKQTVLQLAVMGKLVPQDPNDQPASVLLEKIAAEKEQLIKEKKIKKQKALPPIGEDEKPFGLPDGWEWSRFSEVAYSRLGKMLDKAKDQGESKKYLRNTNVQWQKIDLLDIKEMKFEHAELQEFELHKGDLLICEGGEPGRCAIWQHDNIDIYFQKALHRARTYTGVIPEYLEICLMVDAANDSLAQLFTGATIKHLTGDKLSRHIISIPPSGEQARIISQALQLSTLCNHLKTHLQQAQQTRLHLADAMVEKALG
ncbi:restriction endonuclease subunit S [Pelagibaculum spongiae]|uniref:restriction endonuclease subunit S n=1 Tax=Pelagibaculum spongiae TaxID=2080658 RepID=UPI0019D46ECE|nr:restriction endonuclease subunit S [Pelagibaculum spongiae]